MSPRAAALVLALPLAGCDLFAPGVEAAVVERVSVDALPLDQVWDGAGRPDVYLDVFASGALSFRPDYRSPVAEDVAADDLPLTWTLGGGLRVPLDRSVVLRVADRDLVGDDLMFAADPFSFADRYDGAARGETATLVFADSASSVRVTVRWD